MTKIITDSSSNISQAEAEALGITVIPLSIIFDTQAYLEDIDITADEFYRRLAEGEFPHTSQPSYEQFARAFETADGEEAVAIFISSALSGTIEGARSAVQEGGFAGVRVVDSLATTTMLRMMVMEANRNREKSADELVAMLAEFRSKLRLYAVIDTLEYLHRGGRLSKGAMIAGSLLNIKPLITIARDGTIEVVGKALGQKKALKMLESLYLADAPDRTREPVYLYSMVDEAGRKLIERTGGNPDTAEFYNLCSVVGAHIGLNAAGITFVSTRE